MNNKRNRNTTPVRDEAYWLGLVERFFAAQTSEAEEKELREFLLSSRGADARYDEVRAVMGFLAVGRDVHGNHTATPSRPVAFPFGGNLRPSAGALWRRANAFYWAAAVVAIAFSACVRSTWGPTGRVPFAMPTSAERKPQTSTS